LDFAPRCLWKTLEGLIFQENTKSPKMDHLPVENPGGSRMGDRKKVQIWSQKKVACGHTLKGKNASVQSSFIAPAKIFR
jgi:hypothetical protein